MKTLSFHNLKVGRQTENVLLEADTQKSGVSFSEGLNIVFAPNGYGKSTLLQTMAGLLPPLGGEILLEGKTGNSEKEFLYLSEYLAFPKFIYAHEWIEFVAGVSGSSISEAQLKPLLDGFRFESKWNSFLGQMSHGERRKTNWIAAHFSKKSVILMDEPFNGLDFISIHFALSLVQEWKKKGKILCFVTHQIADVFNKMDACFLIHQKQLVRLESRLKPGYSLQELQKTLLETYS